MANSRLFRNEKPMTKYARVTLGDEFDNIPLQALPNRGGYFAYFKLNDKPAFVEEGAKLIAEHIKNLELVNPYFVTPEASTLALAHVLRTKYGIDGCTVYKSKQINDVDPICVQYDTVTATDRKQLFLCKQRAKSMLNKQIIILDSICTTGGTLRGTYELLKKAGVPANNIVEATVLFIEGEHRSSLQIDSNATILLTSFSHLPIIKEEEMDLEKGLIY